MMSEITRHPASYRDPSGFLFYSNGKIYRQVNKEYAPHYEHLMQSGLYELLIEKKLLIPHQEIKENMFQDEEWFTTLFPEQIPFISYPYEWCFDQLKDAALLTLNLVKLSVEKGMILKDATALNVQFLHGKPVWIDSLSFEKYDPTQPWIAYRQFCEHFLFPLLLAHYHKTGVQPFLHTRADGIPVDLTAKLLPFRSRLNMGVYLHVFLQNKFSKKSNVQKNKASFSKKKLLDLISHLEFMIRRLSYRGKTVWSHYYSDTVTGGDYLKEKEAIIQNFINQCDGNRVLDIGANDGHFSLLAASAHLQVTATDNDEGCINTLYKKIKEKNITNVMPLCIDIANPTPDSGFENAERNAFMKRNKADIILALALVHHLAIGKNIPLPMLASFFSKLNSHLIIEYVPKDDEKAQLILANKNDIYQAYTKELFEKAFEQYFRITSAKQIPGTGRWLYLMKRIETI